MTIEYRPISPDEFPAFAHADNAAFGFLMTPEELEAERSALEFDRTIAALEDDRIVGTSATLSLDLTLPGGEAVPAGGLTWTGVMPTHRRRGHLAAMVARQLDLSAERSEPLNILLASESTIYERFGYGIATYELGFTLATAHGAFRPEAAADAREGGLELVPPDEAPIVLPPLYQRVRPGLAGAAGRTKGWWNAYLADPERHRDGASGLFHVLHRDGWGMVDGYASYRVRTDWGGGVSQSTLVVAELLASTPVAHAALWRYCLDMDLVAAVSSTQAPVDEPLRWLLRDPRRFRVDLMNDGLWVRILDVPTALEARTYGARGPEAVRREGTGMDTLVLEIGDGFRPATAGRYLLEAGPEGASCARTSRHADLALDVADLGAAYLGGVGFGTLARARRVQELTPGAVARADALFRTERAPSCSTHF